MKNEKFIIKSKIFLGVIVSGLFNVAFAIPPKIEELNVPNVHQCTMPEASKLIDEINTKQELEDIYQQVNQGREDSIDLLALLLHKNYPKDSLCWRANLAKTGKIRYLNEYAYHLAGGEASDKQFQDIPKAITLYQQVLAKDPTNIAANLSLGQFYEMGYGVPKDTAKALQYYLKAAIPRDEEDCLDCLNYPKALFKVANAYHYGIGTPVNREQALVYYKRLFAYMPLILEEEKYLAKAQLYETGLGGKQNAKLAAENYFFAAVSSSQVAQYKMSELYREGKGLPKDKDNAEAWLEVAKLNQGEEVAYYF